MSRVPVTQLHHRQSDLYQRLLSKTRTARRGPRRRERPRKHPPPWIHQHCSVDMSEVDSRACPGHRIRLSTLEMAPHARRSASSHRWRRPGPLGPSRPDQVPQSQLSSLHRSPRRKLPRHPPRRVRPRPVPRPRPSRRRSRLTTRARGESRPSRRHPSAQHRGTPGPDNQFSRPDVAIEARRETSFDPG